MLIYDILQYVGQDLLDIVLPFVLVYTMVWGLLQKTKVLGTKKNVDAMTAFAIAFLVIASARLVNVLHSIATLSGFAIIIGVFVLILSRFLGAEEKEKTLWPIIIGYIVIALIAIYSLGASKIFDISISRTLIYAIFGLGAFALVVWMIIYEKVPDTNRESKQEKTSSKEKEPVDSVTPPDLKKHNWQEFMP